MKYLCFHWFFNWISTSYFQSIWLYLKNYVPHTIEMKSFDEIFASITAGKSFRNPPTIWISNTFELVLTGNCSVFLCIIKDYNISKFLNNSPWFPLPLEKNNLNRCQVLNIFSFRIPSIASAPMLNTDI